MKQRLCFFVMLAALFLNAAAYDFKSEGIEYSILDAEKLTVSLTSGQDCTSNTVIPATVENMGKQYTVVSIDESAFDGCVNLTSIEIPNTVTSLGEGVFRDCTDLMSVSYPNSLSTIPYQTFYGCTSLTSLSLPKSILTIEEDAFRRCVALSEIKIPDSVTKIEEYAFDGCIGLKSVELPASINYIEDYAFNQCTNLKDIYYGASQPIKNVGEDIFESLIYSMATLWVPEEAVAVYMSISPWNKFHEIKKYDFSSGVKDIVLTPDSEWGELADSAEIYTLDGIRIYETPKNLAPGVYIILQGNESRKISVK